MAARIGLTAILSIGMATASLGLAAQTSRNSTTAPDSPTQAVAEPAGAAATYRPPSLSRLKERTRVASGAVRGARSQVEVHVLAPRQTGLTTKTHPKLYWFASQDIAVPVELSIDDPASPGDEPLFIHRLKPPVRAGLHVIDTGARGLHLRPNSQYIWQVLVLDARGYSRSRYAEGTIELAAEPPALGASLAAAPTAQHPGIYARAGFWYDALEALNTPAPSAAGGAATPLHQLQSLLEQEDLAIVARSGLLAQVQ
jgi:hypothetical protein